MQVQSRIHQSLICAVDNERVLGYDNSHEYHYRHFMGTVEPIEFDNYKAYRNASRLK
jgi:hypothetical protein